MMHAHEAAKRQPIVPSSWRVSAMQALAGAGELRRDCVVDIHAEAPGKPAYRRAIIGMHPDRTAVSAHLDVIVLRRRRHPSQILVYE